MQYYSRKTTNGNYRIYRADDDSVVPSLAGVECLAEAALRLAQLDPNYALFDVCDGNVTRVKDLLYRLEQTRQRCQSHQLAVKWTGGFDQTQAIGVLVKQASLEIQLLMNAYERVLMEAARQRLELEAEKVQLLSTQLSQALQSKP